MQFRSSDGQTRNWDRTIATTRTLARQLAEQATTSQIAIRRRLPCEPSGRERPLFSTYLRDQRASTPAGENAFLLNRKTTSCCSNGLDPPRISRTSPAFDLAHDTLQAYARRHNHRYLVLAEDQRRRQGRHRQRPSGSGLSRVARVRTSVATSGATPASLLPSW